MNRPAAWASSSARSCARSRVTPAWPAVAWNACAAAPRTASARPGGRVSSFSAIEPEPTGRRILRPGGDRAAPRPSDRRRSPSACCSRATPAARSPLATALFDAPAKMFNHNRGLWGYTGTALDGAR